MLKSLLILSVACLAYAQHHPHFWPGRTGIVHLFEWKWKDVAAECENFLAPKGFGAVQVEN